ncbi:hypothetical protein JL721_9254 [Aureococcus anophagefferens]|nr:hypothetical protein JL721_9254 [Aureococcus anophagefferens]
MAAAPASTRVFVQNLPPGCGVDDLKKHFGDYDVTDVQIPKKKGARAGSRGIAFVGFRSADDAAAAIKTLDKAYWRTSKLRVSRAEQRKRAAPAAAAPAAPEEPEAPPAKKPKTEAPKPSDAKQTRRERFFELMGGGPGGGVEDLAAPEEELRTTTPPPTTGRRLAVDVADLAAPAAPVVAKSAAAFDDGLDDLAYLRSKQTAVEEEEEEDVEEAPEAEEASDDDDDDDEEEKDDKDDSEDEDDDAGARLYVANLPYDASEEEILAYFSPHGTVSEVHQPLSKETRAPLGFAFVTFVLPTAAEAATASLDGASFRGRALSVAAAEKQRKSSADDRAPRTFSERREQERKKKALAASHGELRGHAELFKASGSGTAVNLALAEATVQAETLAYFRDRGYDLDADARSRRSVLVKNLPADASAAELRKMFAPHGVVHDVLLAPSRTTAVVEFEEPSEARAAFKKLAYRRFRHVPLYLGWAPEKSDAAPAAPSSTVPDAAAADDDEEVHEGATVFVKNLNFKTTAAALRAHFSAFGVRACSLPAADGERNNRGYGFLEFDGADDARAAIATTRAARRPRTKLVVRNLAFAVVVNDVKQLFEAFGALKKVRLPKRFDGRHRGFAFVEFTNPRDAAAARSSLKSAHLYGRHLVIDWADPDPAVE